MSPERQKLEWLKCSKSITYFFVTYLRLFNATEQAWVGFDLWPGQEPVLAALGSHRQLIILKARQLGMTWLMLGYFLHRMLFAPAWTGLLFSRRDDEAMELLSEERLKGMYSRLPDWMRCRGVTVDNAHEWVLSNGSRALAFPTTAGDSYTANAVLVDEADLVPNLNRLMRSVKPTIDNGGQLILLSRADKEAPLSEFKQIYRAAKRGENGWHPVFLPWSVHPGRDLAWYNAQRLDAQARTGALDDLYEQYPATDEQALAPRQKDKRLALAWIEFCKVESAHLQVQGIPALPGLTIYQLPERGRRYMIGADSAEGNPSSDDSVACVIDVQTWAQVATLAGKLEPGTFGAQIRQVATYYNRATVMPERQNHGHATILALQAFGDATIAYGLDGRPGWNSDERGKVLMYDLTAEALQNGSCRVACSETRSQLANIENNSLRAPNGLKDDYADAFALALAGCRYGMVSSMA
ncbi:MAG: hypothetical protein DYG89_04200 [Caldilinea sp. CFX5]|nr:hypothetical protein [Caldilinea sp. CFX5]